MTDRIESLIDAAVDRWEVRHLTRPVPRRRQFVMATRNLTVRYGLGVPHVLRARWSAG